MNKSQLLHLVADYGAGDPAFAEVIQKLTSLQPDIKVNPVPVPKYSTLATGFWIYQLASVNAFEGLAIYSNTAPRRKDGEDTNKTYKGQFGQLAFARLDNGVNIIAVHYGYAFSYLKPILKNLYQVNISNTGTQFRSRDNYPEAVIGIINSKRNYIGEKIDLSTIPEVPSNTIAFIDGYGNIKTTNRASKNKYEPGQKISVHLNDVTNIASAADQAYHISDGEIVYAPGSSGGSDKFMEIWVRNGSAHQIFNRPKVEQEFTITPIE